eukprot:5807217-Pyramimonas_sp.AAC.1
MAEAPRTREAPRQMLNLRSRRNHVCRHGNHSQPTPPWPRQRAPKARDPLQGRKAIRREDSVS